MFWRLANDGEIHRDLLCHTLELVGVMSPVQRWVDEVFEGMSKYTTLDLQEFVSFVEAYEKRQDTEYAAAFQRYDADGSGSMEASELSAMLAHLGITPMDHVIAEILREVDSNQSGNLDLQEFGRVMALLGAREGFAQREFDRLMAAFRIYDADGSGALDVSELIGVLGYLHYSISREDALALVAEVDVDGSGSLNGREFLLFMRKVRECEVCRLQAILTRLAEEGKSFSKESSLFELLRGLHYYPDREAVLEAAADAGLDLPKEDELLKARFRVCLDKVSANDKIGITLDKSSLDDRDALRVTRVDAGLVQEWNKENEEDMQIQPGDDILEVNGVRRHCRLMLQAIAQERTLNMLVVRRGEGEEGHLAPKLSLGEAWRFLEVYRSRDGLTRAEAEDLGAAFRQYAAHNELADSNEISTFDAGRALRWLGYQSPSQVEEQLMAEVGVNASGRLGIAEFQKLVRKFHERELDSIRSALTRLGLWRDDNWGWISEDEYAAAMRAIGCSDKDGKVARKPGGTDLSGLMHDAMQHRRQVRSSYRRHCGFGPREVEELRTFFDEYDTDRGGSITHAELRRLCEDLFPELATSMKNRHELISVLNKADAGWDKTLDFKDFLRLMREFVEIRKRSRRAKESRAVMASEFTAVQVREFREVFIAADIEERDCLSFTKVRQLIHRIAPLGDKRVDELTRVWQHVVTSSNLDKGTGGWDADFSDFLLLMRHLLDTNFAGIKDWSARMVH